MKISLVVLLVASSKFLSGGYGAPMPPQTCSSLNLFVVCQNDKMNKTIMCIHNNMVSTTKGSEVCTESSKQEGYVHVPFESIQLSERFTKKVFNYSDLVVGSYSFNFGFLYKNTSELANICAGPQCHCHYSTTLTIEEDQPQKVSTADVQFRGLTSEVRLQLSSKHKVNFAQMLEQFRTLLRTVDSNRNPNAIGCKST